MCDFNHQLRFLFIICSFECSLGNVLKYNSIFLCSKFCHLFFFCYGCIILYLVDYCTKYLLSYFYSFTISLLNRDDKNRHNRGGDSNNRYIEFIQKFLNNKTHLLLVLSILFTSFIFYPLIVPHLYHPSMIFHISLHILSLNLAIFLTVISILSFKKTKSKKVFLTSLSFSVLLAI